MHRAGKELGRVHRVLLPKEVGNHFDVMGLRKEVEGNNRIETVAAVKQAPEVSRQRRGIAGDIGQPGRSKAKQTGDCRPVNPGPRWIEQNKGGRS